MKKDIANMLSFVENLPASAQSIVKTTLLPQSRIGSISLLTVVTVVLK